MFSFELLCAASLNRAPRNLSLSNFPRGWKANYWRRKASHRDAHCRRMHRYRSCSPWRGARSIALPFVRRTIITRIRETESDRTFNVCTSVYTLESICRFAVRPATSRSIRRLDHQLRSLCSTPTFLVGLSSASRARARSDHASFVESLCCTKIIGNKGN